MPEIAVAVHDPSGKRFAHLVHDDLPVRELMLILADRLELPTKLNYQLLDMGSGTELKPERSLAQAGVGAGANLQLRPVRDRAFDTFVEVLQREAEIELRGEARRQARETLGRLLAGEAVTASATAAAATAGQAASETATSAAGEAAAEQVLSQASAGTAQGQAAQEAGTAAKSGASCFKIGCIGLGLLVAATAVAGAVFFDDVIQPVISELGPVFGTSFGEPRLGTGDVQVTLRWDTPADLDLHVFDPSGEEVYYGNPNSQSGGTLDVDANGTCDNDAPVENIFWPEGGAPTGTYEVYVRYFQNCGHAGSTAYTVSILVDGVTYGPFEGFFSGEEGESDFVTSFER